LGVLVLLLVKLDFSAGFFIIIVQQVRVFANQLFLLHRVNNPVCAINLALEKVLAIVRVLQRCDLVCEAFVSLSNLTTVLLDYLVYFAKIVSLSGEVKHHWNFANER
jgi:hypothetical protein